MKFFLIMTLLISTSIVTDIAEQAQVKSKLAPCPNSPNCVSSQETKRSKKMAPLEIYGDLGSALQELEEMMLTYTNATLIDKSDDYLHYEFLTKIGKFIDDVEFEIDKNEKVIHFRSASRKGYGDFGKNKRRMKNISKNWVKSAQI